MSGLKTQALLLDQRRGVKNLRNFPGFDNTGATEQRTVWAAAAAGGGLIEVPAGAYLLNNFDAPTTVDVTFMATGRATILWDRTSSPAAIRHNNVLNVDAADTVTAIAFEDAWPAANTQRVSQRVSKISLDVAGYAVGDYCHLMSDDTTHDGYIKGELFQVAFVGADYILADRAFWYSYSPGTYTTVVRRLTHAKKFRMVGNFVFDTAESPAAAVGGPHAIALLGTVEPELIGLQFDNCYSTAIRLQGVFGGLYDVLFNDMDIDYSNENYAYGTELRGPVYGGRYDIRAVGGGHSFVANAGLASPSTSWTLGGVPMRPWIRSFFSRGARTHPLDCHYAIEPQIGIVNVFDPAPMPGTSLAAALFLGAVDPFVESVTAVNCSAALRIRDCRGNRTTFKIGHVNFQVDAMHPFTPSVISQDGYSSSYGGNKPAVDIGGGTAQVNGRAAFAFAGTHAVGFDAVLRNFAFIGGPQIAYASGLSSNRTLELDGCTWDTDESSINGILYADVSLPAGALNVRTLHIRRRGSTALNGLVRGGAATVSASIMAGAITLDGGPALAVKTANSHADSVVTVTKPEAWGERTQAPAGSATVDDDAGLVLMSHTSGTPTITLKDPARFPGRKVTIKNLALSSGGNVTVAAAAGTISGATTLAAATKDRATYIANGSVWEQVA